MIELHYKIPLSDEQMGAVQAALSGSSVAVDSCAGSGKSHTAFALAVNYSGPVHSIPFSRNGADTEKAKYKGFSHVQASNFHVHGLNLLRNNLGKIETDFSKVNKLATEIDGKNGEIIANLVTFLKNEAYGIHENAPTAESIADKYEIDKKFCEPALQVLAKSDADKRTVDFPDMLRLPVLLGLNEGLKGLIILDEVQDYTPSAFCLLRSSILHPDSSKWHIFMIGDPSRQALMMFAGANPKLFDEMAEFFGCARKNLTVNRRCSKAVINAAPFKGDMQPLPDAPEGFVGNIPVDELVQKLENREHSEDAVLSEANAPLVLLGIKLLTKGVPVKMRLDRLNKLLMRYCYPFLRLEKFPVGTMAENLRKKAAEDFAETGEVDSDLDDVIKCVDALETYCLANGILKVAWPKAYVKGCHPDHPIQQALKKLAGDTGVTLMTGHTAKGLEWNTVFHLPGKMKAPTQAWQVDQANCLAHVIATRAKLNHYTVMV